MTLRWLRGANRRPRYLGVGKQPNRLYRHLKYLTGPRAVLERLIMTLPTGVLVRREPWDGATGLVRAALGDQPAPERGLFLFTGYYKDSLFVGPVVPGGRTDGVVFWKGFRSAYGAARELERAALLASILPREVRIPDCRAVGDALVEYGRLPRAPRPLGRAQLLRTAVDIARLSRCGTAVTARTGTPAVPLDDSVVTSIADLLQLSERESSLLMAELDRCRESALFLSHGDLTPWNAFRMTSGCVGVVDFDAVGFRPPFFDLVHAVTQQEAENRRGTPRRIVDSIASAVAESEIRVDVALCLFWDAYETMIQCLENPANSWATMPTISLKLEAWRLARA